MQALCLGNQLRLRYDTGAPGMDVRQIPNKMNYTMCVGVQFNFYIVLLLSLRLRLPYRVEDRAGKFLQK